jgi:Fe-S-cluster containining protein
MVARIAADWRSRVDEWIARDRAFAGSTRLETYDCMQCAACCFSNHVVLDAEDQARWQDQKRLFRYTKKSGSQLLLVLQPKTKACPHLEGTRCGIYVVRPNMCREFPAGSEHCITSREERFSGNGLGRNVAKRGS